MARTKRVWQKGGGGFGPVSRPPAAEGAVEPSRLTAQERAAREIRKYQRDGGYLIPRTAFIRLTQEIFNKMTRRMGVLRMQQSAIDVLQMMAESHVALAFNSKLSFSCQKALPSF